MAGISSRASGVLENKHKYNGIEFENDFDLNTYDAFFRELDPQTGRWWQVDPKIENMEMWSPYASNFDNPIKYNDFLGDEPESVQGDPPGIFTRAWNAYKGAYIEAGNWIKNTAKTLEANRKENWASGNTIPQQFVKDALANPISLIDGGAELNIVKRALGMEVKGVVNIEKSLLKYEVGTADNLLSRSVKGDGLDIHHVSQSKPASQIITGYERSKAPAIALPLAEHKAIPTLKGTNTAGSARQQLAKDVKDLRKFTNAPNQSIQQVIDLNKKIFPLSFIKN